MYERTATGLAPEIVHFNSDDFKNSGDIWSEDGENDFTIKP